MKTFKIDGVEYTLKSYDDNDVCNYLFKEVGECARKLTIAEYKVLYSMLNAGFTPHLSYYGRPTGEMYPQAMWFSYRGVLLDEYGNYTDVIDVEICYKCNYSENDTIVVYEGKRDCFKLGTFTDLVALFRFLRLNDYIPVTCVIAPSGVDRIVSHVQEEREDYYNMANGIDVVNPVVPSSFIGIYSADSGLPPVDVTYHIDYNKLETVAE